MENEACILTVKENFSEGIVHPSTSSAQFEVLFNDVILHRLFCCMDFRSLQICRVVCKKWKDIAEPIFKNGCRVLFDFSDEGNPAAFDNKCQLKLQNSIVKTCSTVTKLIEIFGGIPLEIPFTSFRLKGHVPLTIPVLGNIFNCYSQFLKEISFDNVTFPRNNGDPQDISELIAPSTKKLNVDCSNGKKLTISQNRLVHLKSIQLTGCIVNLNIDAKIFAHELELKNIWCIFEDERVDALLVNQLIDLQKINTLKLIGDCHILDLSEKQTSANLLQLSETKMLNWKNYHCTINKFILHGVPFLTKNALKIKELVFSASSVDLSVLPKSLERLSLKSAEINCSENSLSLHNLKYLQLEDTNDESSCLSYFANCANLVDMKLESCYGRIGLIFNNIPKCLHKLHLTQVNVTGSGNYKLEKLILQNYDFQIMCNVLQKLQPDHLVISICDIHLNYYKILKFLRQKSFRTLAVGKFIWQDCDKNNPPCPCPVEKFRKCYFFVNGHEKILEENEFEYLLL